MLITDIFPSCLFLITSIWVLSVCSLHRPSWRGLQRRPGPIPVILACGEKARTVYNPCANGISRWAGVGHLVTKNTALLPMSCHLLGGPYFFTLLGPPEQLRQFSNCRTVLSRQTEETVQEELGVMSRKEDVHRQHNLYSSPQTWINPKPCLGQWGNRPQWICNALSCFQSNLAQSLR